MTTDGSREEDAMTSAEAPTFPFPREDPRHPPQRLTELLVHAPVSRVTIWDGSRPWLVTRHADVRFVLSDPRFSADHTLPGYPGPNESMTRVRERYPTFVTMDNPRHDAYRKLLTREFTVRRIEQLRPSIRAYIAGLIAELRTKDGPVDFVEEFALAVPSAMICDLLGVPHRDQAMFQGLTRIMASSRSSAAEADRATNQLCESYLRELIALKEREPTDDLYSRLVVEQLVPGHLSEDEVVALGRLLLVAGHDTTSGMLGLSVLSVLLDRALRERLVAEPKIVSGLVEELLRFWNIDNFGLRRVALEDVEVGGQLIRAGEGVITSGQAADRDAGVFSDPHTIDPQRPNVRSHQAFGFGIHQCLGQNLARAELQEVLGALFTEVPTLELATPLDEVTFDVDMFNYGVESMLVRC
jgi:cytochrome P450